MRVTLGELLTQLDLQELCHDGIVGHRHEGRAGAADPDGLGAAVEAGVAHGVVVGDEATTIGLLNAIVVGGGNQVQIAGLETARHAGDAAHLPYGGGKRNLLRHDLARLTRVHLVGWNDGNKTQAIAHLVAQALGERIGRRKGADGAAQDSGGDVIGMALDLGGNADELGAVDGVARQRGGGHNAGDNAGGAGTQATSDGNVSLNVDGDGEGRLAPCGQRIHKAHVD